MRRGPRVPAAALLLAAVCLRSMGEGATGDAVVRARAGGSEIDITTTARLAGAIHSLTWNGKEFINSSDHGRQLQSACSFDNRPDAGPETFNPTEAGSRLDGAGLRSTSRLLELFTQDNRLRTRTQMAFWLAPGERSEGQLARNTKPLSDYVLTKVVQIGYGRWTQVLDYSVTFTVPTGAQHTHAQFEALTGYMPAEFEHFWQFNQSSGRLEPLNDGPGEIAWPVVLATADGRHAMGIYAPPHPQPHTAPPRYGRWRFQAEKVVKWNCVFRVSDKDGLASGDYTYRMLVPVGSVGDIEAMLRDWIER